MVRSKRTRRRLGVGTMVVVGLFAVGAVQCSAGGASTGGSGGGSGGGAASGSGGGAATGSGGGAATGGNTGFDVVTKDHTAEEFFVNDPPPANCDGGGNPPTVGGTPECPDDKNLAGCPCPSEGATAACWPGYRKNRNRGACNDGTTTCVRKDETQQLVWDTCDGYTGIDKVTKEPLGTTGKAACKCFSGGFWNITNLSPCFISDGSNNVLGGISTEMTDDAGGAQCPAIATQAGFWDNPVPPGTPWSTNQVTVDCTGYFKLCYTLKALSAPGAAQATSDCVMKQVCTEDYYATKDQPQGFPPLPAWVTATAGEKSCAQSFVTNGGYAEMSVVGQSDECDTVDKIFQTVTYCPLKCADPANAQDPECANCTNGGGGSF